MFFRDPRNCTLKLPPVKGTFHLKVLFIRKKTLRNYSRPVLPSRFDRIGWMTAEADLWPISDYMTNIPHG